MAQEPNGSAPGAQHAFRCARTDVRFRHSCEGQCDKAGFVLNATRRATQLYAGCMQIDCMHARRCQMSDRGKEALARLLGIDAERFAAEYLFKKPHLKQLSDAERAAALADPAAPIHLLDLAEVKRLLRRREPRPTRWLHDVDATRYIAGRRQALAEGNGEVDAAAAWKAFERDGYSLRMVHPQQWHAPAYELCACLQEFFGFACGCSSYLTPPRTQGFPPHYDDVEIIVLQLEGTKRWRLYERPDAATAPSPRVTTEFKQEQLGPPTAEIVLAPGDVLYFPRGTVHQAMAQDEAHSLHLTFSTYQRHTWRDLLEAAPLSAEGRAALASLAQQQDAWVHTDLPTTLLDTHTVGRPDAA